MGSARSFHSTMLLGMLLLAAGAVLVLAIAAVWFTHHLTRDFTVTRLRQNLTLVDQRVEQLAEAAVRFNALACRHLRPNQPLPTQFQPVMTSLADAFDLQRKLSYVGLAVESTGEYSMLQRTPGSGATRNREYTLLPDGTQEIRDYHLQDGKRVVVAHPEPNRILDSRTRLLPTNSLGVSDPVVRAILNTAVQSPALFGSPSSKPLLVRAGGAAYYWTARRFETPGLPRWSVVTVLPRDIVLQETRAVYRWLAAVALVLVALSAVLANRLAKHVAGPLRQLQDQMAGQSAQSNPGPVTVKGAMEFRLLAESFNGLITGINRRDSGKKRAWEGLRI